MAEKIGDYAPPSDELLEVLGMRLIDIMNKLAVQMEANGKQEDYIAFKGVNGFTNKFYYMTVNLKEIK